MKIEPFADGLSLAMLSPKDKLWQEHKLLNQQISNLLIGTQYESYAHRMSSCATFLAFQSKQHIHTGETKLHLKSVQTCKVRIDSICSWAKSRVWQNRLNDGLPKLMMAYPTARGILVTLTVKTCDITQLRVTLDMMSKGFARLLDNRDLKSHLLGYIRTMEVTRLFDWYDSQGNFIGRHGTTWFKRHTGDNKTTWQAKPTNECHPHYHVLFIVKPSYFNRGYKSQKEWSELWQKTARLSYLPVVDVRAIKPSAKLPTDKNGMLNAIKEVSKYCVKHSDVVYDQYYLVETITQLHNTKHVVLGGLIKEIVNYKEPTEEDILKAANESLEDTDWIDSEMVYFSWNSKKKDYLLFNR
jgi:plasmid rolling circle replication initiator protein Rep